MHLAFCGHFVASKCILVWLQIAFDADLFARCVAAPPPPPSAPSAPSPPPPPAAASHRDPVGAGFSSGCDYGFISGSSSGLATGFGIVAHNLCLCVCLCVCVRGAIDCDGSHDHFLGPLCGLQPQNAIRNYVYASAFTSAAVSASCGIYVPNYLA